MGSLGFRRSLFLLVALLLVAAPWYAAAAAAASCAATTFSNRVFATCSDLPHLAASLHWTYDRAAAALSVAFVAPPAAPSGWVAWAINPTAEGMAGSQALIAFKQPDGTMGVKTYNITGYGPLQESPIAYKATDLAAEYVGGAMRVFAKLILGKGAEEVNHVWQVGSAVSGGSPEKHAFGADNLAAKGKLDLVKGVASASGSGGSVSRERNVSSALIPFGSPYFRNFCLVLCVFFLLGLKFWVEYV